jgi:hypothetical protein
MKKIRKRNFIAVMPHSTHELSRYTSMNDHLISLLPFFFLFIIIVILIIIIIVDYYKNEITCTYIRAGI